MNNIAILVNRKKKGLLKECHVLQRRFVKSNFDSEIFSPRGFFAGFFSPKKYSHIIIYNICLGNVVVAFFLYVSKLWSSTPEIIWQNHEPLGFSHKLRNNSLIYALVTTLIELFLSVFADKIGTPNSKIAKENGFLYLPLQYDLSSNANVDIIKPCVFGYLGRIDPTRLFNESEELVYFPGDFGTSEADKKRFMVSISGVINIYTRPHAQSGVTPDALSFRKYIAVGYNDAWADLDWGGFMLVVQPDAEQLILARLGNHINVTKVDESKFEITFSECFGDLSFKHWIASLNA